VWGSSAKYQPMRVGKDHLLADEDVIQIVKKCAAAVTARCIGYASMRPTDAHLPVPCSCGPGRAVRRLCVASPPAGQEGSVQPRPPESCCCDCRASG
jgi:hypothetical protein